MKKVLMVIPFVDIYPPMNGGKLRAMNLLHQLSRHFEVTVITLQDRESFSRCVEEYPAMRSCTIFGPGDGKMPFDVFSFLPKGSAQALRYRWWRRDWRGPAEGNFMAIYPILRRVLKGRTFDQVILEEMGTLDVATIVRRKMPHAHIIYDAYNVNTRLAATAVANGALPEYHLEVIRRGESALYRRVDTLFACSEQDLAELVRMNENRLTGTVVPNGVKLPEYTMNSANGRPHNDDLLFCGSLDYFPNREGLGWFCKEILPLLLQRRPSIRLLVVGRGEPGEELTALLRHEGVVFYGMVERVSDYYAKAAIAIVPLLSGSGTRLKLLEAFGYAIPVVSTTAGAEGIEYIDKENILIGDDAADFAGAVLHLLENPAMADNLGRKGYAFAKGKYDWDVIGEGLSAYLNRTSAP